MPGQHRIDWEAAKTRTDAIVPWITVFGLIAGGVYSLVEYRNHERDRRIEATMAYVTRYMAPPLSDYRAVLVKRWQALLWGSTRRAPSPAPVHGCRWRGTVRPACDSD